MNKTLAIVIVVILSAVLASLVAATAFQEKSAGGIKALYSDAK